jgi:hypothetical protein
MLLFRLGGSFGQLDIIVLQQMGQDHFHLATGKMAPGARPYPMAEIDVVCARRGMLIFEGGAGLLSQFREPEAVKLGRVRPQVGVHVEGVRANHDSGSVRDYLSTGKLQASRMGHDSWHIRYVFDRQMSVDSFFGSGRYEDRANFT